MLSSAHDDRLGRLERRSRETDVVQLWSVDAMDVTPFKVCGASRGGSESGSKSRWKRVGMIWKKVAGDREGRIAQIRCEAAGELVRTKYTHFQERIARSARIVQTQAHEGGRVGQSNS